LKLLVNAKVLTSTRGAKGGYALAHKAQHISLVSVISAVEGPIALTECSISEKNCTQASGCHIYGNWQIINRTIHNALAAVTLADMLKPIMPKEIHIPIANITKSN
jgi:Rrf2 family protein